MSLWIWVVVATVILIGVLAAVVFGLYISGRREDAKALVRFVPDCARFCIRLARDPRVPWYYKALLIGLAAYLASPIDLIPGSPIDDAVLAAIVLPIVIRGNAALLEDHWPGPAGSLAAMRRVLRVGTERVESRRPT